VGQRMHQTYNACNEDRPVGFLDGRLASHREDPIPGVLRDVLAQLLRLLDPPIAARKQLAVGLLLDAW
jgi:hypothetical protein